MVFSKIFIYLFLFHKTKKKSNLDWKLSLIDIKNWIKLIYFNGKLKLLFNSCKRIDPLFLNINCILNLLFITFILIYRRRWRMNKLKNFFYDVLKRSFIRLTLPLQLLHFILTILLVWFTFVYVYIISRNIFILRNLFSLLMSLKCPLFL